MDLWGGVIGKGEVQALCQLYAVKCQQLDGMQEGFPHHDVGMMLRAVDLQRSCVRLACPGATGKHLPLALLERHGKTLPSDEAEWGAAVALDSTST